MELCGLNHVRFAMILVLFCLFYCIHELLMLRWVYLDIIFLFVNTTAYSIFLLPRVRFYEGENVRGLYTLCLHLFTKALSYTYTHLHILCLHLIDSVIFRLECSRECTLLQTDVLALAHFTLGSREKIR